MPSRERTWRSSARSGARWQSLSKNAWAFGEVTDLKNKLTLEKLYLEGEIRSELKFEEIVGKSEALRRVLEQVETVAPTDSTVLIYGETGTARS